MQFQFDSQQALAQTLKFAPRFADAKVITAAATSFTTGNSPLTLFTVDGDVLCRVFATVQTLLTSTSNNGTLAVGVTGATTVFLPTTTMDGSQFPAGSVWMDSTPTVKAEVLAATPLNWAIVAGGADIIATIATNSATAGAMTFYCQYIPLSLDGRIIPA